MKIKEAVIVLEEHNKWRLGADVKMTSPKVLTEAINTIVEYFKDKEDGQ